ncbi:hypothetical protein [Salinicola acroporae]|uniref:hypothetical protein n=1 Tax=Salinicola acroporae TaxID=1541440 RepID=UPI0031BB7183
MATQSPACQLLARQDADYRGWLWVAPPRDGWLESGEGVVWSADLDVCSAWQRAGRPAYGALTPLPTEVPGAVLFWPKSHALGEWWLTALNAALPAGTPLQIVGENQGASSGFPRCWRGWTRRVENWIRRAAAPCLPPGRRKMLATQSPSGTP